MNSWMYLSISISGKLRAWLPCPKCCFSKLDSHDYGAICNVKPCSDQELFHCEAQRTCYSKCTGIKNAFWTNTWMLYISRNSLIFMSGLLASNTKWGGGGCAILTIDYVIYGGFNFSYLTLPKLRLLSSKARERNAFTKPCHVGIH